MRTSLCLSLQASPERHDRVQLPVLIVALFARCVLQIAPQRPPGPSTQRAAV